jgi:hypothetical protein
VAEDVRMTRTSCQGAGAGLIVNWEPRKRLRKAVPDQGEAPP